MEEELDRIRTANASHHVTAEAIDYDSDDVEACEVVPTIELSAHEELCDLEASTDINNEKEDEDSQSESMGAIEAIPLGSLVSTGGMPNVYNSSSRAFRQRAEFCSATIIKPTKRTELGLSLSDLVEGGSGLCISGIKKNGFLFESGAPFEVGDRVLSINNHSCDRMDHKRAAKLLREAPGSVSIVVQNIGGDPLMVECMITKPSPGHRTGIGFTSSEEPPQVNVSTIFLNGLFADSLLTEGDEVVSVNSIPCRELDSSAVADIIISASKYVTIVAKKFEGNGVVVAFDGATRREQKCPTLQRWTNNDRSQQSIGPGCQLLFCVLFITAMIILIFYMQVYRSI